MVTPRARNCARDVHPVDAGQHHVDHGEVEPPRAREAQTLVPVGGGLGGMPFATQALRHESGQPCVVLDQQDLHVHIVPGQGWWAGHPYRSQTGNPPPSKDRRRTSTDMRTAAPRRPDTRAAHRPSHRAGPVSFETSWRELPWSLRILRAFLGVTFVYAGLQKFLDPGFLHAGSPTYIGTQLQGFAVGTPAAPLMRLLEHVPFLVGLGVAITEIAVGVAVLSGIGLIAASVVGLRDQRGPVAVRDVAHPSVLLGIGLDLRGGMARVDRRDLAGHRGPHAAREPGAGRSTISWRAGRCSVAGWSPGSRSRSAGSPARSPDLPAAGSGLTMAGGA